MKEQEILVSLENLLRDLAIELRYEVGDFLGGLCWYNNVRQMIVNKNLTDTKKIQVIANEIKQNFDLENLYLVPALREVIENANHLE